MTQIGYQSINQQCIKTDLPKMLVSATKKREGISRKPKMMKLELFILRMAPKIIEFARLYSKTCRRRNSHQILLFPGSRVPAVEQPLGEVNRSLRAQYQDKYPEWYSFYFSDCKIFIDNHHLQIFKPLNPIDYSKTGRITCFGLLTSSWWEGQPEPHDQETLFLGTESGCLLAVSQPQHCFLSSKVSHSQIQLISRYKNWIVAYSEQKCHILTYSLCPGGVQAAGSAQLSEPHYQLEFDYKFAAEIAKNEEVTGMSCIEMGGSILLFYITENGLFLSELKEELLCNMQSKRQLVEPYPSNPFTNMKIHHERDLKRVLIVSGCTQEVKIYSYRPSDENISILFKMPNPKKPPSAPRRHIPSCIEFITRPHQGHTLVVLSFTERIYFVRVWADYCEVSRRVKFYDRVLSLIPYNRGSLIIIMQRTQPVQKPGQIPVRVILVSLASVISFSENPPIHTDTIDKIEFDTVIHKALHSTDRVRLSTSLLCSREILILGDKAVHRVGLMAWVDIYINILETEGLQLLYFLILLKKHHSPFLTAPADFAGLEKFMEPLLSAEGCGRILKQAMLEYYYEMGMEPPVQLQAQIQSHTPELFLPLIFSHKVSNLSEHCQELMVDYWRVKDDRVVLELIVGGVEHGWQLAIKNGWMRALHRMVEMGIEIQFPLLKLSSFLTIEVSSLAEIDECKQQEYDRKVKVIESYCGQFISYGKFALANFLQHEALPSLEDLKEFLLALFGNNMLSHCIRHRPYQAVRLVSQLFSEPQFCSLIDTITITSFVELDKNFSDLLRSDYLSLSETLLSHLSEQFRQITSDQRVFAAEERAKLGQQLIKEHAKLLNFSAKSSQGSRHFRFLRGYLHEMLITLVSHNNYHLKELIWELKIDLPEAQLQYFIQDYLTFIWHQLEASPDSDDEALEPLTPASVKDHMSMIEQANGCNYYLMVQILSSLPNSGAENHCPRMLKKYLQSSSWVIRNRVFEWLMVVMKEEDNRTHLSKELINHLQALIEINKEKSRELFDMFFKNQEKEIIRRIGNAPLLQLEYLEMIIEEYGEVIEDYYLDLHLNLLLHEEPHRLIHVLEQSLLSKVKYNLHEALKRSLELEYPEKNRVEMYLFEKLGDAEQCIQSYLKTISQLLWDYADLYESTSQLSKGKDNHMSQEDEESGYKFISMKRKTSNITLIFNDLIHSNTILTHTQSKLISIEEQINLAFQEFCQEIFSQPVKKYEYLSQPLNCLLGFTEEVKKRKLRQSQHYGKVISYYFGKIIVQSFERGYLNHFVKWMKDENRISISPIKHDLIQGYHRVKSQAMLLRNMSIIDQNVLIQNIKSMLEIMELSIFAENVCPICTLDFEEADEGLLFNCGHLFHRECIEEDPNGEDICWQCMWNDQIKTIVNHPEISLVNLLEKYSYKKAKGREREQKTQKRAKVVTDAQKQANRLAIFDKKVVSLRDQAEILDMKLEIEEFYRQEPQA